MSGCRLARLVVFVVLLSLIKRMPGIVPWNMSRFSLSRSLPFTIVFPSLAVKTSSLKTRRLSQSHFHYAQFSESPLMYSICSACFPNARGGVGGVGWGAPSWDSAGREGNCCSPYHHGNRSEGGAIFSTVSIVWLSNVWKEGLIIPTVLYDYRTCGGRDQTRPRTR
jgi:hypothetical protein